MMMRLKPQEHPIQRDEPAEHSNYRRSSRYTLWKARRVRFCHTFRMQRNHRRQRRNQSQQTLLYVISSSKASLSVIICKITDSDVNGSKSAECTFERKVTERFHCFGQPYGKI